MTNKHKNITIINTVCREIHTFLQANNKHLAAAFVADKKKKTNSPSASPPWCFFGLKMPQKLHVFFKCYKHHTYRMIGKTPLTIKKQQQKKQCM